MGERERKRGPRTTLTKLGRLKIQYGALESHITPTDYNLKIRPILSLPSFLYLHKD